MLFLAFSRTLDSCFHLFLSNSSARILLILSFKYMIDEHKLHDTLPHFVSKAKLWQNSAKRKLIKIIHVTSRLNHFWKLLQCCWFPNCEQAFYNVQVKSFCKVENHNMRIWSWEYLLSHNTTTSLLCYPSGGTLQGIPLIACLHWNLRKRKQSLMCCI